MSLKNVNKPEKNVVELEFTVDKEIFDDAINKVYKKNVVKMNVPGFRKGKAPKNIVEKMYGKGVFYEDALNEVMPTAYSDAVKEASIDVVSRPEIDVISVDDSGVLLKAKVFVKPEVTVSNYIGLTAERKIIPVMESDIDSELKRVSERNSRLVDITDRPAQKDDSVIIDFDGYVDNEPFEGGKSEKYNLKIGSGQFIPGFEEQIIGKNIGDTFDVNVEFPAEYHAENLAGKPAVFKVVLHEIKFTEYPSLDDEFAKDVSEFDTLDEYKSDIRAKIEERNIKSSDNDVEGQLIDGLIANLDAEIPAPMFEAETENFVRDYDNKLRMQGLDLGSYFKYTGLNLESLREQFKPQAQRQVKTRLALEKIVEIENITAEEVEISDEYEKIAKAYNMELEQIKTSIDSEALSKDIAVKKAVDFIKAKAIITEKAPEAEIVEVAEVAEIVETSETAE